MTHKDILSDAFKAASIPARLHDSSLEVKSKVRKTICLEIVSLEDLSINFHFDKDTGNYLGAN